MSLRFILITTLLAGSLTAADFFVAPNGSDKNPGTLKQPFFTIQRAQKEVSPATPSISAAASIR